MGELDKKVSFVGKKNGIKLKLCPEFLLLCPCEEISFPGLNQKMAPTLVS